MDLPAQPPAAPFAARPSPDGNLYPNGTIFPNSSILVVTIVAGVMGFLLSLILLKQFLPQLCHALKVRYQSKRSQVLLELQTESQALHVMVDGQLQPLYDAFEALLARVAPSPERFQGSLRALVTGAPVDAARGLGWYMGVPDAELYRSMAQGVAAIEREVNTHGTDVDRECLEYVLHAAAGSSPLIFPNSPYPRDCDENGTVPSRLKETGEGMVLQDFVNHPNAQHAGLTVAHVLAVRLYSTAAFRSLNDPLRQRSQPHPVSSTIAILADALRRLRSVEALADSAQQPVDLWRGMAQMGAVADSFEREGGTELAPMSTTSELSVAFSYAASAQALLFKIASSSFMDRGADISWLSAFPGEREYLFPPLTYLRPTGRHEELRLRHPTQGYVIGVRVVEVSASFGS